MAVLFGLFVNSAQAKPKEREKTYHLCTSSDTPENILACAMYWEARGEKEKGMVYVGNVILNRSEHDKYPSKIKKVVYQKAQFSYIRKRLKIHDKKSWDIAKKVAKELLSQEPEKRRLTDKTKGATMFVKKGRRVYWTKRYQKTVSYGKHDFYRERIK